MSSTPSAVSSGSSATASSRVDPDGPGVDVPNSTQRRKVGRPADLDLERGEIGRPGRTLGDDRRLVKAQGEVGRWEVLRETAELVDGDGQRLADEVVQGDIDRTAGRAMTTDGSRHRPGGGVDAGEVQGGLADGLEQHRHDR